MQWWCAALGIPWEWSWRPYPGVWLFIAVLGAAFLVARRSSRGDRTASEKRRTALYPVGLVVLWVALDWPMGALGAGYLASAHMVQFLLIAMVAPPLLILGLAGIAGEGGGGSDPVLLRVLTHPLFALAAFTVLISLTHWPPLVDPLMSSQLGNFTLDLLWILTGLLFWWPVVGSTPHRSWLSPPVKIGYLIAGTVVNTGVFAYLTFSDLPLYAIYELAPPVAGISTRDDQILAGLLMKVGGAVVLWTAITVLFFRWYVQHEKEEKDSSKTPARV